MTSHTGHLPPNYRWNFWAFFVDFVGYMTCLTFISPSSVLPAFVRELTDSPTLIGLSGTIFAAGYLLPQLLVAHWVRGKPRTKPFLMATLPGRGLFLVITLALWAGMAARPTALLILFFVSLTLFAVNDGASNVPWNEFVARAIPLARRGRLFGLSQIIQGIAGIGAGAVISRILGDTSIQFPNNYIILFLAATAPLIPSSIALMLLKEPPPLETADRALTAARTNWRTILSRDGDYRRILVCRALLLMAGMAIPFYVVHAQDVLGLPGNVIGVFVMAQTLSSVAASALFGFVSDRWGPRYAVRIATIAGGDSPTIRSGCTPGTEPACCPGISHRVRGTRRRQQRVYAGIRQLPPGNIARTRPPDLHRPQQHHPGCHGCCTNIGRLDPADNILHLLILPGRGAGVGGFPDCHRPQDARTSLGDRHSATCGLASTGFRLVHIEVA